MCNSTVLDHNIFLLAGLLGHEKCLVLYGLTKNVATLVGMTGTKFSMEENCFCHVVQSFPQRFFRHRNFLTLFRKKSCAQLRRQFNFLKYMSTSSFVGLFAVSGVLAVDGDPAVADMHAVLTSMLMPLSMLLLALLLLALLLLASLHHSVAAGRPCCCKSLEPCSETIYIQPCRKIVPGARPMQSRSCDLNFQAISKGLKKSRFSGPNRPSTCSRNGFTCIKALRT